MIQIKRKWATILKKFPFSDFCFYNELSNGGNPSWASLSEIWHGSVITDLEKRTQTTYPWNLERSCAVSKGNGWTIRGDRYTVTIQKIINYSVVNTYTINRDISNAIALVTEVISAFDNNHVVALIQKTGNPYYNSTTFGLYKYNPSTDSFVQVGNDLTGPTWGTSASGGHYTIPNSYCFDWLNENEGVIAITSSYQSSYISATGGAWYFNLSTNTFSYLGNPGAAKDATCHSILMVANDKIYFINTDVFNMWNGSTWSPITRPSEVSAGRELLLRNPSDTSNPWYLAKVTSETASYSKLYTMNVNDNSFTFVENLNFENMNGIGYAVQQPYTNNRGGVFVGQFNTNLTSDIWRRYFIGFDNGSLLEFVNKSR